MDTDSLNVAILNSTLMRILLLGALGFFLAMVLTPLYTTIAYKWEWWKRQRTDSWSGGTATVYNKLHAEKHKRHIPTMAGLIFVTSIALVTLFTNLNRGQTWLPLAGMVAAGAIGLIDDFLNIRGSSRIAGMRARTKFALYSLVALIGGWWFYAKLGVTHVYLPGVHEVYIGAGIVLLFWFVVVATANSVNISDGLDGLAGGLLTIMAWSLCLGTLSQVSRPDCSFWPRRSMPTRRTTSILLSARRSRTSSGSQRFRQANFRGVGNHEQAGHDRNQSGNAGARPFFGRAGVPLAHRAPRVGRTTCHAARAARA